MWWYQRLSYIGNLPYASEILINCRRMLLTSRWIEPSHAVVSATLVYRNDVSINKLPTIRRTIVLISRRTWPLHEVAISSFGRSSTSPMPARYYSTTQPEKPNAYRPHPMQARNYCQSELQPDSPRECKHYPKLSPIGRIEGFLAGRLQTKVCALRSRRSYLSALHQRPAWSSH
jgi:hypothetical protein